MPTSLRVTEKENQVPCLRTQHNKLESMYAFEPGMLVINVNIMPRSYQNLNMFKSCLVKHGLKLFSL